MEISALHTLIESARLAPSGDNTQPWQFELQPEQRRVRLHLDPARDKSPMNAGQNMARIALGAALENMAQVAQHNEWQVEITCTESSIACRLLADYPAGRIPEPIIDRASNRKKYNACELPQSRIEDLRSAMKPDEAQATWITRPEDRRELCQLIGEADSIMLSMERARRAFLEKVRFDQPVLAVVDEGLSIGSLELSPFQRLGLRMMPSIPDVVLKNCGGPSMFRQAALRLARSAAGFCVVTSELSGPQREFQIGRVFQRAWLALTQQQFESQPMMSLLVLRNMLENLPMDAITANERHKSKAVLAKFDSFLSQQFGSVGSAGALLRFGECQRPSVRTGRLAANSLKPAK